MQEFYLCLIVGAAAGGLMQFMHQYVYYEIVKLRLVPWRPSRYQAFRRRVRNILQPSITRQKSMVLFAPLPLVLVICWNFWGLAPALAVVPAYLVAPLIGLFVGRSISRNFQTLVQKLALDRLMRHSAGDTDQSEEVLEILKGVTETGHLELKIYAIQQIARLGLAEGDEVLVDLVASENDHVSAAAATARENLAQMLEGGNLLSARQLPVFIDEAEYWNRQYYSRQGRDRGDSKEKHKELVAIINDIVDSQLLLRQRYPNLWCNKCLARTEEHQQGRWTYVLCRHCGDVLKVEMGIVTVVGLIGDFPKRRVEDGVLYLNVWDSKKNRARYADLDRLEVVGGASINYDWAVSALVTQIREHEAVRDLHIQVVLRDDPPLDANSKNLLREIGWDG